MTREEAVEEVNKAFEPAFANYIITALTEGATVSDKESTTKNCESCRYYGSHHEVCNYCYKCSLWTEQEPRWIPVTERLPDNSGRYWVNYSSGYVGIAHYYESVLKWGCTTTERIVAWMPLPKPYKAESEE